MEDTGQRAIQMLKNMMDGATLTYGAHGTWYLSNDNGMDSEIEDATVRFAIKRGWLTNKAARRWDFTMKGALAATV